MRYFIGILITVGLIVLILVLILGGGSSAPKIKPLMLVDYSQNDAANAQLIIDGPIVSDQNHQEIQIDVTDNHVTFTLFNTYTQQVAATQTYNNNPRSYGVFLQALQHAGFTLGNPDPKLRDERGYCPGGNRNIYTFTDGSSTLMRYWSTSCGGTGTSKGQDNTINTLFKRQVPDYVSLTKGVNFGLF